jgi:hypothetical protein
MPETYSYTGSQLAAEVKSQFGDTGNVQVNDTLILRWINNGQRDIAKSNPWNEQVFVTNLLADQAVYDLDTLMGAERVQSYSSIVADNQVLQVIPWAEYLSTIAGRPLPSSADRDVLYASEYGGKLTVWPTPASSIVSGLTIYYVAWPADLTAIGDPLTVPDRFYNALSDYVFARALQLDENFEAAAALQESHDRAVAAEMQRDKMDPTDYYPSITFEDRWT